MNNVNMSDIAHKIQFIYGDECEKNTVGMVIFRKRQELYEILRSYRSD